MKRPPPTPSAARRPRLRAQRTGSARAAPAPAPGRTDTQDLATRERLVRAAAARFAEHGFNNVSVRDICRDAAANVAAVNYHFNGKLGLYREVVAEAIDAIRAASETAMFASESTPPAERIRHYVRVYVPRIAGRDPGVDAARVAWIHKLMRHESSEPTPLAPWIAEQAVMPRVEYLGRAVADLLGCDPADPRVRRCVISIQAQCLFYAPDRFRDTAFPGWPPSESDLAAAAEHIAEFSLAGIERIGRRD
jgi:TetR/AcrR family transcriptional regulator, regulator of cefoperazone and chloramphenicol sensitivity